MLSLGTLLAFVFLTFRIVLGAEFSFVEPKKGKFYVDDYFNRLGLPDIRTDMECPREADYCLIYFVNHRGRIIAGPYNTKTESVDILGKASYRGKAIAFVERTYKVGDRSYTQIFLLYHDGTKRFFKAGLPEGYVEVKPLPNGNVFVVAKTHIYELSPGGVVFSMPLPREVEYAYIGNNPYGAVSAVAVGGNDLLFISYDRKATKFVLDTNALTTRGDRLGVLSIYPETKYLSYSAVYRYVNPYNKGIVLYEVNFQKGTFIKGFLFNSEDRNVGFDPSVFSTRKEVVVSAKNSTEDTYLHFVVPKSEIADLPNAVPQHIKGFEEEKYVEFLVSAKLSLLTWNAFSEVRKGGTTYAKVKYDLSNSLFYGTSLEGRIGNTQIAITYLQNRAERKGGLTAKTSKFLSAVVDLHGLVGKRNTLRIGYEQGKVNGIAEFSSTSGSRSVLFETDLKSYYGYLMMERGLYFGLEYLNYKIPSAVGFSRGGSVVFTGFDPDFTLNSLLLVLGYDHVSYAKRYETNFNSFYFAGNGGIGLGKADISSSVKDRAKALTGASGIQTPLYIVLKAYGEVGYLYQRRAKVLKGFGFSFNLGYRLTFMFAGAGNDGSGSDPNKLYLEFSRYDLLHGPFVQANVIF